MRSLNRRPPSKLWILFPLAFYTALNIALIFVDIWLWPPESPVLQALHDTLVHVVSLTVFVAVVSRLWGLREAGVRLEGLGRSFKLSLLAVPSIIAVFALLYLVVSATGVSPELKVGVSTLSSFFLALPTWIIAGFEEELSMRCIVQRVAEERWGAKAGILVSTLYFIALDSFGLHFVVTLMLLGLGPAFYRFRMPLTSLVVSLVFAYAYHKTRNVLGPALVHALIDIGQGAVGVTLLLLGVVGQ